jgi:hypothetical protein
MPGSANSDSTFDHILSQRKKEEVGAKKLNWVNGKIALVLLVVLSHV